MKILLKNHVENALEALHSNRLRTLLTITGVTIGVAGITMVISLSSGAAKFIQQQIAGDSDLVAIIRPEAETPGGTNMLSNPQALQLPGSLTEKDAQDLEKIANVVVAPMTITNTTFKVKDNMTDGQKTTLIGSNTHLMTIAQLKMFEGDFIESNSSGNSLVVGHQLAIDLFGTEYALGNVVHIRDEIFTVIGILKPIEKSTNFLSIDFNQSAITPMSAIKRINQGALEIQQIALSATTPSYLESATKEAEKILADHHHGEKKFQIITNKTSSISTDQSYKSMSLTIIIVAAFSLIIGGIGIMNIMLVNVAERSREIGIRKAIGATCGNIVNQFLIESIIIGLLGGVIGYVVGMTTAFIIGLYMPFMPVLEWTAAALSIGIAITIGVVFGLYPAVRAANKNPIESLYQ